MISRILFLALTVALLVVLPPFLGLGWQNALTNMLIASLFAMSFNLLMGQGGMLSFGHTAYFGLGAFATLHLMTAVEDGLAFPTVLLPLAGGLVGLLAGGIAGYFATQRAGVYFSLVTLAIAELLRSLAPHWSGMFGGESGLSSMRMPSMGLVFGDQIEVYYVALAWVALCLGLLWAYTRTPFGRLTLALRDNEQRIRFLGYNAHKSKILVFATSALFSGIAGGLLAMSNETANYNIFSTHMSAQVVLQAFVGGSGVFLGPVLGASLLTVFGFLVSEMTRSWLLYQGVIFVLVMLFLPKGLGGALIDLWRARNRLDWIRVAPFAALATLGAVLTAGATVFVVQTLEHILGTTYKAEVARTGIWAPVPLFGTQWDPLSPVTWILPLGVAILGLTLILRGRRRLTALAEAEPTRTNPVLEAGE
jgi:branched-chain amino acid transport system permease protein